MTPSDFSSYRQRSINSNGVALVIVLFAVALVSVVILAFLNLALLNRNISFSSAGQARANVVALTALNFIKGDFIAEIQNGSTQEPDPTGAGVPIYMPTTNATMVPYRMTANLNHPLDPTVPANLIKWSSGSYPLWPATAAYNSQVGPTRAYSGISSTNAAVNGHFVNSVLWTKPDFNTNSTFYPQTVPEWVYLTREGPLTNTFPNSPATVALLANSTATNSNYVVGRYAYTVYDEGGLLDVLAAGYSPTTFTSDPTDVGRKGSQGFADLSQLDPTQKLLTQAQIDQFVNWRNAATGTTSTNYVNYLSTNAPASGFLQAAPGDQAFISRQDLIQYWTTELGASANLLPYLTTFSREKNAPSWGPEHDANDPNSPTYWNGTNLTIDPVNNPIVVGSGSISYAYHDNENSSTVTGNPSQSVSNRFFPNVRVTSAFVQPRLSGEQAVVGEPLVKNRFDLNKLSWITYQGIAPGVSAADVYHYFGLTLNPDGSGSWIYNHINLTPPGSAVAQAKQIMTLDQVAAAGREPDFFELLQAVILQGSLGLVSGDPTHANDNTSAGSGGEFYRLWEGVNASFPYEAPCVRADVDATTNHLSLVYAEEKYQIIQIGANIIDQADTDNFPTDIMLNGEHMYGVENLPYINAIAETVLRPAPGTITSVPSTTTPDSTFNDPSQQYVQQWLTFSLWNPHQNAAFYPLPPNGPSKLRIAVTSGEEYPLVHNLGSYPTAGNYMGRIFEPEVTSGTVTSIKTSTGVVDGPAWIGINLGAYNFSEPIALVPDAQHSFTTDGDNPSSSNMNDIYGIVSSSLGWQRAGIYLGWTKSPDNPYKVPLCATLPAYSNYKTTAYHGTGILYDAAGLSMTQPLTIELQYEDPASPGPAHWHTYQLFRGVVPFSGSGPGDAYMEPNDSAAWNSWSAVPPPTAPYNNTAGSTVTQLVGVNAGPLQANQEYAVNNLLDPRTGRLNIQIIHSPATATGQLALNLGASTVVETGADAGRPPYGHFPKVSLSKTGVDSPNTWINNLGTDPSYYLDRDFNRRVGDAAGWAGASPLTTGAQTQRPYRLDRPFRSVAELGYVFRDDAWKTLNLISANSGDSGLLDIFYIGSRPNTPPDLPPPDIIAGKMNINTAALNSISANSTTSPPLQALLSAGLRDYLLTDLPTINSDITATDATTLASSIISYIKTNGPLVNIGDLPSIFPQDTSISTANPGLKGQREALVRALADSSGTRTWNLMIDVVAQAGKFSPTAGNLNNFTVEGEKHYWLHLSIDRFTGEILDQQLEPVWE